MRFVWLLGVATACTFSKGGQGTVGDAAKGVDAKAIDASLPPDSAVAGPRRKPITIVGSQVPGPLTNFPVWIDVTDGELGAGARVDGSDLYFTDDSGGALPYEIQAWDKGLGHLLAWVRVPSLDHNANTLLYLRYGELGTPPAPSPATVFSTFDAVWHLDDATTTYADALGTHTGTAGGGLDATHQTTGKLGGGIDFNNNTNQITFTNSVTGSTATTISAWVSQRNATGFDAIVEVGTNATDQSRWLYSHYTTSTVAVGLYADDWDTPGTNIDNAGWTLIHWVYQGSNKKSQIYRDGAAIGGTFTHNNAANTQGTAGYLGYAPTAWGATNGLDGILDEVRISKVVRSADWIEAEFVNQSAPSGFYTVGPDEPAP